MTEVFTETLGLFVRLAAALTLTPWIVRLLVPFVAWYLLDDRHNVGMTEAQTDWTTDGDKVRLTLSLGLTLGIFASIMLY